ncbi:hypothetical protein H4582DRAFT_2124719 [Lactarius indigo]|nr:hypothetical protein H4582DRAFT_2124719 [Lactarius indigo]
MPPTSSQQQTRSHTQDYSTYGPGYVRASSTARAVRGRWHRRPQQPNYMPPPPAQPVTPRYDPQPLNQDGFRNTTPAQFGSGNDANWGNPVNGFNYDMTETFGIGAPPPWNGGGYPPQQFQYGQFGQGGINHTGLPFIAEPLSGLPTNLSLPFPGTSAALGNQGALPLWELSNCRVAYEAQDELHLTIVFKKVPSV